ncbi:MAG: porin family protein [Acidobacteriaceae bacterium]|nr:porin family protein [Acidobacteriaceae bacterium]
MRKTILLGVLLLAASVGLAQESRQDVSISAMGAFFPQVHSGTGVVLDTTLPPGGALGSYRYMLTPRSAAEVNYSYTQYTAKFNTLNGAFQNVRVHTRQQEITVGYVYNFNFRNINPFLELGVGTLLFRPIRDQRTTTQDAKQSTKIAGMFGGGIAYELSPSWDIRAQYRGFYVMTPEFGFSSGSASLKTNRYIVVSAPAIGIAYHF